MGMTIYHILGALLLTLPFIGIGYGAAKVLGWKTVFKTYLAMLAVLTCIVFGVLLVGGILP